MEEYRKAVSAGGYRPFSEGELAVCYAENHYLYQISTPYLEWAYRYVKSKASPSGTKKRKK